MELDEIKSHPVNKVPPNEACLSDWQLLIESKLGTKKNIFGFLHRRTRQFTKH